MIAPCPFCGNPRLCVSRRGVGEIWYEKLRGLDNRYHKYKRFEAYRFEVFCGTCSTRLMRNVPAGGVQAQVKREVLALWTARSASTETTLQGFRACPLCGSLDIVKSLVLSTLYQRERLMSQVECHNCGLRMLPGEHEFKSTILCDEELIRLWNERQTPVEWEAVRAARMRCDEEVLGPVDPDKWYDDSFYNDGYGDGD